MSDYLHVSVMKFYGFYFVISIFLIRYDINKWVSYYTYQIT